MRDIDTLNKWLIAEGRLIGDEIAIVKGYCQALVALGVPLARARIAQTYANPLLSAWGIIWTAEKTHRYTVASEVLSTGAWHGSPFEHVVTTRSSLRQRLTGVDLDGKHTLYRELAEAGATDFLAMALEYGDGAVQGASFTTAAPEGFSDRHLEALEHTRHALAAALEPIAMRESQKSLLQTYLGQGPAIEIGQGHIKRGESRKLNAAILFADLRGFTAKSETWPEDQLLAVMGDYFEMVVGAIQDHGGDVLKFMGDGILAVFGDGEATKEACQSAASAAQAALQKLETYNQTAIQPIAFVVGLDYGDVTYGNIGSPDRLDFTVVGRAVNTASRVQELCKTLGEHVLMTRDVAVQLGTQTRSLGRHRMRGLPEAVEVFTMDPDP
ncbi:adenylate/guanylate cyclase [Shimia isoporae]|uniref:Adenylate/guanylate cyclase n=1 Tax=Shimia isoporae TaxID=647720 RepID=A0A4R1N3V2_9RHOB|nr:adenylate/guanylate cyclase domain-containing protein [Shimia isoporae]TCL01417.1 adenylate/guanylate cyclase [Shimia isoporae]